MKLPTLSSEIRIFETVTLEDLLVFTKHTALMLKSGLMLPEAIHILQLQTTHPAFRRMLGDIHDSISNGQPLHKSISKFPRVFDAFYVSLIRVAEESGRLEENLEYLALHLKKQHDFKNKIKGALLYPSIILGLAVTTGVGLSIFVLPKLIDLFMSLDVELPISTKILLYFAAVMRDYGVLIMSILVVLTLMVRYAITTKAVKPHWHAFLLSLPTAGVLLQKIELASLFRNLGTMLGVGIHISTALEAQVQTTTNLVYKNYLEQVMKGMKKGKSMEELLMKVPQYFPLIAVRMIGVGEKTGKLDETLIYVGEYFESEVDDAAKNLTTVLEPIILILVGLVVAFISISIIGPIYQFTGSIKR